jgi:hypothetical protein
MPVGVLLRSMSSSELTEWGAYLKIKNEEQERAQREAQRSPRRR